MQTLLDSRWRELCASHITDRTLYIEEEAPKTSCRLGGLAGGDIREDIGGRHIPFKVSDGPSVCRRSDWAMLE